MSTLWTVIITTGACYLLFGAPLVLAANADRAQDEPNRSWFRAISAFVVGCLIWWPACIWGILNAPYDLSQVQVGKGADDDEPKS